MNLLVALDTLRLDRTLLQNSGAVHLLAHLDLRLFDLLLAIRLLHGDFGALLGAAYGHLALLVEASVFTFFLELQRPLLGIEILCLDRDARVLFDVVALLLARLDLLGQARQAFGVEGIAGIEHLHVGLIDAGEGSRLELESRFRQRRCDELAHSLDVGPAVLVDLFHRHARSDSTHGVYEAALYKVAQFLGVHRPCAECARCGRDGGGGRHHSNEELHCHLDPHPVLGDQRLVVCASHLDAQRVHADLGDVVDDGQDQCPAPHDDAFSAQAGAHERQVLRRVPIQPMQEVHHHCDDDGQKDDDCNDVCAVHLDFLG